MSSFFNVFFKGLLDSLRFCYSITQISSSKRIKSLIKYPVIVSIINAVINITACSLFISDYYQDAFLSLFWTVPVYILAVITNANYHTKILGLLYSEKDSQQNLRKKTKSLSNYQLITELVYGHLVLVGFSIQIEVMKYFWLTSLPFIGFLFGFIQWLMYSWFFGFYIYEYKLIHNSLDIKKRVKYFEERWVYFLGYGFIFGTMSYWLPFSISSSFYLLYLNLLIINTIHLRPVKNENIVMSKLERLPIFYLPLHFANLFVRLYIHWSRPQ